MRDDSSGDAASVKIFLAATAGACTLVVTWALGLNADVGGLIALAMVGLGILAEMAGSRGGDRA